MATSGVTLSQLSRDEIINAALRKLVVIGLGQTADSAQLLTGAQALNALVTEFVGLGMPLWKRVDYTLPLVTGQGQYVFGVGQAVNTPFPNKLYQARFQSPPYDTEIELNILGFHDFNLLPNGSSGIPVNINYQPQINQGTISIWPTPDASVPALSQLILTYQTQSEVFVAGADTPDFPQEWANALIYQTALLLADEYAVPEAKKGWLEKQADKHLSLALSNGTEDASLYLQPDRQGY